MKNICVKGRVLSLVKHIGSGGVEVTPHDTWVSGYNVQMVNIASGRISLATKLAGEDIAADLMKVVVMSGVELPVQISGQAVNISGQPVKISGQAVVMSGQTIVSETSKSIGTMSTDNSTTTPLGISGVFTGTSEDVKNYAAINISIFTNQASVTDGLSLEWSQDGTNWDEKMNISIGASKVESYEFGIRARYFRIVYTNGVIAQGVFRLQTILHPTRTREGARCLCVDIDPREFAPTRRSVIAGKKPDGSYTNIHATAAGNLKTAIEEFDTSLPAGTNVIGATKTSGQESYFQSGTGNIRSSGQSIVINAAQFKSGLHSISGRQLLTNILDTDIKASYPPSLWRIMIAIGNEGQLTAKVTNSGGTSGHEVQTVTLNEGTNLTSGSAYMFDIINQSGDEMNLQYNTSAPIHVARIQEITAGTQ
jgi:hypothetical protein